MTRRACEFTEPGPKAPFSCLPGLGFAYAEYLGPAGRACALRRRTLVLQGHLPRVSDLDLFPTLHAVSLSHCPSFFRFLPVPTSGILFHWMHCVHHRAQFVTCQEGVSTIFHFFENFPMDWGKVHFHPRVCHTVARPIATARSQSEDRRNPGSVASPAPHAIPLWHLHSSACQWIQQPLDSASKNIMFSQCFRLCVRLISFSTELQNCS
jgi:hypothetical protein